MEQATYSSETDADRRDEREVVTRGAGVSNVLLGQLNENVTAEQRAENRFAGGKLGPHIRRAEMHPPFREEIDEFRAEERAHQGRAVNEHEAPILARAFFPKEKADDDAGEQEPGVRRDCHGRISKERRLEIAVL